MKKLKRNVKKPKKFSSVFHGRDQYQKIAEVISGLEPDARRQATLAFVREFSKDNVGFIAHRFVDACENE